MSLVILFSEEAHNPGQKMCIWWVWDHSISKTCIFKFGFPSIAEISLYIHHFNTIVIYSVCLWETKISQCFQCRPVPTRACQHWKCWEIIKTHMIRLFNFQIRHFLACWKLWPALPLPSGCWGAGSAGSAVQHFQALAIPYMVCWCLCWIFLCMH